MLLARWDLAPFVVMPGVTVLDLPLRMASITVLELFLDVIVAYLWGFQWVHLRVEFLCDNEAVVVILNSRTLRDPFAMHLMHHLTLLACRHSFSFSSRHVCGHRNKAANVIFSFTI
jgi:hypothetical protein